MKTRSEILKGRGCSLTSFDVVEVKGLILMPGDIVDVVSTSSDIGKVFADDVRVVTRSGVAVVRDLAATLSAVWRGTSWRSTIVCRNGGNGTAVLVGVKNGRERGERASFKLKSTFTA